MQGDEKPGRLQSFDARMGSSHTPYIIVVGRHFL